MRNFTLCLGAIGAMLLPWETPIRAASAQPLSDPSIVVTARGGFADPSRPGLLEVRGPYAHITVTGTDRTDVPVTVRRMAAPPPGADVAGPPFHLTSDPHNVIRLSLAGNTTPVRLDLEVPLRTSLRIFGSNGGPVVVKNVEGDFEIENSNAAVRLIDTAGSALVFTSNGAVEATFTSIDAVPMSFVTSNGRIDVTFPADLAAAVFMETDNGRLLSDFEIEPAPDPLRRVPASGDRPSGRAIYGLVGGGGPEIRLRTSNHTIHLKRLEDARGR